MSSRAHVCAWIAVCALTSAPCAVAQERSAAELVEIIVRDGPRAIAIRAEADVVRRDQQSRLVYPNPGVSYSREGAGFTEFFQVEQLLPAFGLRAALTRAGVAAASAADADRDARLWQLRTQATSLVARLLWAQTRADLTAADVQTASHVVELLSVREREGEGSRFDRLRAEHELAELRQVAVSATIDAADTRGALTAWLPATVTVTRVSAGLPPAVGSPLDIDGLISRARTSRAELRALQRELDRTDLEAEAARRARRPSPLLSGGLKRADTGSARERGGVIGVNVAVPLFDSGAREAARWTAEGGRIAAERTAIEQEIRADIGRAAEALRLRRLSLDEAQTDALGVELVGIAEAAYREGDIGVVALLDAIRTASRARMRDLEKRLDVRLAEVALERAVGDVLWP